MRESEAKSQVLGLFFGGLAVGVIAMLVAINQWPQDSVDPMKEDAGSAALAYFALAVAAFAQMAMFVAVIAWGVYLGNRWSGTGGTSAAPTVNPPAVGEPPSTAAKRSAEEIKERLANLDRLRDEGVFTAEEYERRRTEIVEDW